MRKLYPLLSVGLLLSAAALGVPAQTPNGKPPLGPVHMTFGGGSYVGASLHLSDVVMTSKDYDLRAASVVADMPPSTGAGSAPSFTKIVALGDPAQKTQVTGRFASVADARTYLVRGDKAVYVPVSGRRGVGRIDFTGHVVVTVEAPQALAVPAATHLEHAAVLVGPGPGYPQVEFGAGFLDFTPLQ